MKRPRGERSMRQAQPLELELEYGVAEPAGIGVLVTGGHGS